MSEQQAPRSEDEVRDFFDRWLRTRRQEVGGDVPVLTARKEQQEDEERDDRDLHDDADADGTEPVRRSRAVVMATDSVLVPAPARRPAMPPLLTSRQ